MPESTPLIDAVLRLVGAPLLALVLHRVVFVLLGQLSRRTRWYADDRFIAALRGPTALLVPVLVAMVMLPSVALLDAGDRALLSHLLALAAVGATTWLGVAVVRVLAALVAARQDVDRADNLEARRVVTSLTVIERTVSVVIIVLGTAAALMTFPKVREVGTTLLMSAGFVGLAVGLAARPVLENLIAGLQLALTQPIRIDDVVIVEGEWGRIEEITTTYVVVRIWDQRRLVVPLSRFIAQPFQNWTRRSADILGTVFLYTDYTVPVDAVREELRRIVAGAPQWDGRVCVLQVTDSREHTLELRALVSAANSSDAWDLRVLVRERLVGFLQREYPHCLPRMRVALTDEPRRVPAGR